MSFLGLEGLHAFVTGAAGGIGSAIVQELLDQGCKVTAHDIRPITSAPQTSNFHPLQGDITSETSLSQSINTAKAHFGPIHILCANAGITDESNSYPIWEMPTSLWDKTYAVNVRGTYLTIKHFLKQIEESQREGQELSNVAIVLTGSECGKFGQAGHSEYASGKAGLQYGLIRGLKNEIVRLNSKARINAVAPGWVDTPLIEGRLDDEKELYKEAQATVPLRKIAKPEDVARVIAFLASHRAAGHVSGECLSVDGGMEGRIVWERENRNEKVAIESVQDYAAKVGAKTSASLTTRKPKPKPKPKIKIALSVDFDAVSGWLGTGQSPENKMADYSSGFFAAQVGVPRLLKLFKKHGIADKVTWFVPMHSAESFPEQFEKIKESGAEIGLHGYSHEGAPQLTESQEIQVLTHCISLYTKLLGHSPLGYRAPLYQLRPSTLRLLSDRSFLYDSSLTHHDSQPYFLSSNQAEMKVPNYTPETDAREWMHPLPGNRDGDGDGGGEESMVEIPVNWYGEDMTPLQYWPHTSNSQGYVDVRVIEKMWMDRFEFILREIVDEEADDSDDEGEGKEVKGKAKVKTFGLVLHPDTSGMAHVIGMIERIILWLKAREKSGGGERVDVVWEKYEDIARSFREET